MEDQNPADVQRRMWTIGDYAAVARRLLPISVETVEALPVEDGVRVLDVGTGDGNFALEAARRGATVVAVDLTPAQIERAQARAAAEGLDVELRIGDAEELDVPDDAFDVVASVLGMMFATDHVRAAAEMVRACRPGGTVAAVAWAGARWSQRWQQRAASLVPPPPPGGPRPDLWGDLDEARQRWEAAGLVDVRLEQRPFAWHFGSLHEAVEFFTTTGGPFITFLERAEALGVADAARDELAAVFAESASQTEGTVTLDHPYVLAVGTAP